MEETVNNNLLKVCRYYKGEAENPFAENSVDATMWFYEKRWCNMSTEENEQTFLHAYVEDYTNCKLKDFNKEDGAPLTLKALLFNRFSYHHKGSQYEDAKAFPAWYREFYTKDLYRDTIYYKGEKVNPYKGDLRKGTFWLVEKSWITFYQYERPATLREFLHEYCTRFAGKHEWAGCTADEVWNNYLAGMGN